MKEGERERERKMEMIRQKTDEKTLTIVGDEKKINKQ